MDVAVIGIACRFPGANDHHTFWANLAERKASISVVPSSRWDWKAYWGDSRTQINKSLSKWGGFIERVDAFDNQFFGVLPKVAQSMDPQQRIMLELTWACLEDAGIPPSQLRGRKVGVIVGVFNHDYKELQERDQPSIEAHNSTGTATAMIANRVSHYFDFRGPSIPVDTACSSSLNAIHSAIQAMEYGDCEMALAGGINLLLTPTRHISFSKMGMLSPSGICKTFDDSADGYVRGEGAGLLLLKPLDKALSDGDSIYGVIKGSAVNHCGATYTLTYPSPRAQAEVIVAAHERAGIPVDSVGYIEAHGTGTPKGDPIEFEGLLTAFQTLADKQEIRLDNAFCGLSSVKTNIGHLEAAAGVAGAIKVLMSLKHRILPALHDFTTLNAKIAIDETPFYILGETREWTQADRNKDQPRRAGVSSFGFGGTNAHLVLEEAPLSQTSQKALSSRSKHPSYLIALSAKSNEALQRKQKDILAWLRADAEHSDLLDISATLLTRRDHFQHRFSCIAANVQDLIEKLDKFIAIDAGASVQGRESLASDAVPAGQKLLKQLSAKRVLKGAKYSMALQQLADLYAAGVDLPWLALFGEAAVQPVSLPTYPFSRDSFWISESDGQDDADRRQVLHPALQRNVSMIETQRYASTFTGKEFFLADHVIRTRPVLPGVVYLEMVRAAIVDALGAGAGPVHLSDVLWMRPLEVAGEPVSVHVELRPESAAPATVGQQGITRLAFQVTSAETGALQQIYCRGSVGIVSARNAEALDIAALKRACDGPVYSAEQCYRSLASLGLNYGPAQQAVVQLYSGTHQCVAELSLPAQLAAASAPYVIHPSIADAALQAAVALVAGAGIYDASATTFLPFALDRLDVYQRCTAAMHAWVRYAPGHSAGESNKKVDIDVSDADGRVCLAFRGLSIRPMAADASFAPPMAHSSETRLSPKLRQSLYAPLWIAQPIAGAASEGGIDHLLLVGDPGDASWLTHQLRASSQFGSTRIEHLYLGAEAAVDDGGALHVRPGRLEDYEAAVAALAARGSKLDHVLLIAPRLMSDMSDIAQVGSDSLGTQVGKSAQNLFALVKAMMRGTKRAKFLHLVSGQPQRPEYQGLSGLYKTLRIEKPSYSGRVVQCDLAELPAQRLAELVFKEFHAADKDVDVSYSGDVRSVRKFHQLDANALPPASSADLTASLRKEGVYLITGGMGALGLIFARHLCERYQATVFLTGRSAPTELHRLTLNELSSLGGHASFLTCDVVNRDDVRRAIDSIHAAGHQLNGVIHSAGVIEDDFILRKSPESFARVVAPKTLGTWHLDIETRDEPLDFFALFSSVTGVLGNIGQCDYGFGNAFEDYFAHQREALRRQASRNGKTLSINWPYWKEGGMRLSDKEEENLQRSFGLVPLLSGQGIEIFEYALTQPYSQLVVMPGDTAKVQEVLGVVAMPMPVAAVVAAALPAKIHSASYALSQPLLATGDWSTAVARYLAALFAAQLQISSDFELDRSFREYGFDSIVMIDLVNLMEKKFGSLPKTLFFEHQTLGELTAFFIEHHAESCRAIAQAEPSGQSAAESERPESTATDERRPATDAGSTLSAVAAHDDIAIIGLSGRYPEAESLEQFWENLKLGRDCVVEIPSDRWDIETTFQPGPAVIGKTYSKWGGFLKEVDQFDPLFFNISPKEAENMDPNERLFLETAALTIEDAGYTADKLVSPLGARENPVGVYVGLMWGDYQLHGVEGQPHTWATPHSFYWAVANRVSHYFNFSGPSITIDTACSSSLTAIHLACAAIRAGEIGVAIAGAVNLSLHINKYNLLSDMHFLSTDGRCRSFGDGGDGYVPGEGVGAVLLKSLAQARADGDHIYGIIRGSSVNHGGKTSGFTVPNPKRQAMLVQDALQAAGVNPRHVSYLEAHGTGTSLGDPIEIAGLNKAFAQQEHQYCAIGSVKSNIGHLEAASGIAGLTKILLQMKHRALVPSIQSDVLNPYIDFKNCPFYVQRELQEWRRPWLDVTDQDGSIRRMELPRLAGVSSFGAGGSNAHLIVEEYIEPAGSNDQQRERPVLIVLSARKQTALRAMAENFAAFVEANPQLSLQDAAFTLQTGRVAMEHRLAVVAVGGAELVAALRTYSSGSDANTDLFSGHRDQAKAAASALPVAQWLAQSELRHLAKAWVGGHAIEWPQLHAPQARKRLSLPGYVFQRQRYWVTKPGVVATSVALHPLIDSNVSTLEEQAFRKTFRAEEFFLRDHQLGSNRILPGVAYLEMALAAGRLGSRDPVCALRDVQWLKPIFVNQGSSAFDIGLIPAADGVHFEIYQAHGDARQIYSQGVLEFEVPAAPTIAGRVDLHAIIDRCQTQSREAIAAAFTQMGFNFGPSFQVFDILHFNADEALAKLSLPTQPDIQAAPGFTLPPSLLDGAVRTALAIGGLGVALRGVHAPVRLQRIEVLLPIGASCFAHARRADVGSNHGGQHSYDIDLLDAAGQVLARIEQLVIQAAPSLGLSRPAVRVSEPARHAAIAAATGITAIPLQPRLTVAASNAVSLETLQATVVKHLVELLSAVTKVPVEQIDPKSALENYGIDSVMILALTEQLHPTFGEVPKTLFYEYQDLHSLSEYFLDSHAEQVRGLAAASSALAAAPAREPQLQPQPIVAMSAAVDQDALQAAVVTHLIDLLSAVTKVPVEQIDPKSALENYGIDSVMILALTEKLQPTFGEVPKTLFYEYQDLHSLSEYFLDSHLEQVRVLAAALPSRGALQSPMATAAAAVAGVGPVEIRSRIFACLQKILGGEARNCTEVTALAEWPIDPVSHGRLQHALRQEFGGIDIGSMYRHESLDEWAAAIQATSPQQAGRALASTADVSADGVPASADTVAWPSAPRTTSRTPGSSRFSQRFAQPRGIATSAMHQDQEIAIIGLSGRYPGARNVEEFWQNLSEGRDSISEIPLSRWDHQKYYHPDRNTRGQVYSKWGGFIDDIDQFDAGFFGISPREAEIIDPQERLFLQTAWECLEDACYTRQALKDRDVGVFVGVMWGHYEAIDVSEQQRKYGRPAALSSSIANRVSYFLNLNGPSVALDTMCSSSLTAIHLASQAIRNGDCQMAIAGGVNLIVHPLKYQLLAQGQFLSTDGRCRAFGDGGDGYVPGEGVGAVLLKPLRQAIEDGDQIHAVIKASAVNHGGKTNGYTVPNQVAQSNVIGKALRRAGWHPSSIDYIEAHGTGTSLGDPIEIAGLSKAFSSAAQDMEKQAGGGAAAMTPQSCRIGSVKSNIGHLESAAGMAALTKILLQMRHRRIAPSLHSALLNTNIDFAKTPFRVVQALEDWHAPAGPGAGGRPASRRAGISSFGAGGANAHVLIEEYEAAAAITPHRAPASLPQPLLFVLSADSEERLTLYIDRVLAFLVQHQQGGSTLDLRSLAYSSLIGREAMSERFAVVISTLDDLIDALVQYRQGVVVNQAQRGSVKKHSEKLDAILDETQRDAMVRSLLQDKRLPQLAKAWVSLLDIEWSRYADLLFVADPASSRRTASVRRLSFPVMPFLTKRHWVEERPAAADASRHDALHPLLDCNVSTLTQQRYAKLLTGQEFYLRDHIVEAGQKRVILPGVAYLEMARAAGELAMGEEWSVDRIRNLIWIQPVEIKDTAEEVIVTLTQVDDAVEFDITRRATGDASVEGELHYRRRGEAVADEWLDLDVLRRRGVIEEDKQAIYDSFRRMGFHYGDSYQVTETRYRMADGALSRLRLPEFLRHDAMAFCLHPSLFDGALRACLAIDSESPDATLPLVPFALGELEIRHPLTEECYAYATAVLDAEPQTDLQPDLHSGLRKYNIVVTDSDGRVLIKLWNFSARQFVKAEPQALRTLQYYGYGWREVPALPALASTLSGWTVLLIADDASLAETLSLRFAPSVNVVLAQSGAAFAKVGERHYRFDPADAQSYTELLTHLASQNLRPSHIAHCLQDVRDFTTAADHDDVQSLRRGMLSMRHLFNALEQTMPGQSVRCAYVFEATRAAIQPQHDAVSGYARSLLTINHRFELFTVRAERSEAAELGAILQNEFEASGTLAGLEIAHWNGRRYLRSLTPFDPSGMPQNALPLKSRGAYLITGGAGKLGLVLARYLATHYQARLILSGRSERLHDEALAQIAALRAVGADVHYHCSDIAQAGQADALLAVAKQVYGRLDGILHCAGVASDTLITQLDEAAFAELLAPKIDGLLALDRATRSEPLDFFVNFSSVSAMLGDLGSGAYAVANRFMDSYAVWRDALCKQGQRFGKSLSIGWPLWATGGMKIAAEDASLFSFSGMSALTEAEGIEAFERLLRGDMQQVLLAVGDAAKIGRALRVHVEQAPAGVQVTPRVLPFKTVSAARTTVEHDMRTLPAGAPSDAPSDQQRRAEHYLKERLAIVVKVAASDIGRHATFEQLGMDSVMLMELRNSLTQDFAGLPKTALFEYDTPARLAQYLMQQHANALRTCLGRSAPAAADEKMADPVVGAPASATRFVAAPTLASLPVSGKRRSTAAGVTPAAEDAVAIIGLAGQFPQAVDLGEFWSNLQQAKDCLSSIPEDRWQATGQRDAGRGYCNMGGFLSDADRFDPAFFRMSQTEAAKTDPQLRVLLRAAWHAIEDAAYTPEALLPERVGVYVGAMNEDFTWIMSELYARTGEYQGPGSVVSELANRISFLMNFRGPSLTVSTACSSSLTAIHMARQSILSGECDMALAGGVNLSLHPSKYLMLQDMKVLSPDGQERTFDESANGLVPSEGVGMVLLKRLSRALADGDQIYGVIRGSSISHAGTGAGQYLPNLKMLEETAARSLRESGLRAEDLSYIESHGTGTELGDPIELKALANALRQSTSAERFCAIGTKANLGHMEAASGVCSLIKVLLSMKHGHLSPCAKLTSVNSSFEHEFSPFHFPREPQQWNVSQRGTRAAGINSFGMGGSNVFMVLESKEPAASRQNPATAQAEPSIIVLSAKSEDRLRAYASAMHAFLAHSDRETWSTADFADLAYSSQIGRTTFEHRLAIVATDRLEFIAKAGKYLQSGPAAALGIFADGARSQEGLPDLLTGNAGREFIDALLQARQWNKLASIWARGCAIDWSRLHLNASRRRVSFPAYPFETFRCELHDVVRVTVAHGKRQVAPGTGTPTSFSTELDALPENALSEDELQGKHEWFSLESTPDQALQDADGRADEDDEMARQYWIDHLQDIADSSFLLAPALLPEYAGQDAVDELPAHSVSGSLGRELTHSLQRCTQLHRIEVETLVAAAWAILINRYTKVRCSQFGILKAFVPVSSAVIESDAGGHEQLHNFVPVRICTAGREKIAAWLTGLQRNLNRKRVYAHVPIHRIENWIGVENLFDNAIAFEKSLGPQAEAIALATITAENRAQLPACVAMKLTVSIHSDALDLNLTYRSAKAEGEKLSTLLDHFQVLLEGLAANPGKTPAALTMRTKRESRETFWKTLDKVNR